VIIILEGLNGVGKTTVGMGLSEFSGIPFHRPFRLAGVKNGFYPDAKRMRELGVPINCYHEEVYISDFLRSTKCPVILDRSLPSSIVYGLFDEDIPNSHEDLEYIRGIWRHNMQLAGAKMIYFKCDDYEVAINRCGDRMPFSPFQYKKAVDLMDKEVSRSELPTLVVNAEDSTVLEIQQEIIRNLNLKGGE